MYICIPQDYNNESLLNCLLYHSINNYTLPIVTDSYDFKVTDFNNKVFLFYILDSFDKEVHFYIFKNEKIIIDNMYKTNINEEEYNTVKLLCPGFINNNVFIIKYDDKAIKIYQDKKTLFESELKHYFPNGACKEYVKDYLQFSRIYKMGIPNGYGTEYNNTKIVYNGGFYNYKYHGKGVLYYSTNNIKYDGTFENGYLVKGTENFDYNGGIKYTGTFLNNKYHGKGILYYNGAMCNPNIKGKIKYEGDFINNTFHGEGTKYNNIDGGIEYKGIFANGRLNGEAIQYNQEGAIIYKGSFINDVKHGKGIEYYDNKIVFEGIFSNNLPNGKGTLYNINGLVTGNFIDGKIINKYKAENKVEK